MWHYSEAGSGQPLILLHGIGMSHHAWSAVVPYLSSTRRVIAFDVAGFGQTPPLPAGTCPTVATLVDALARSMSELGIDLPVDMAGNSLGGAMALEAARRGLARQVVAISPSGLWQSHRARHVKWVFGSLRFAVRRVPWLVNLVVRSPLLRELALAVPISTGSRRMSAADARRTVSDLAAATAFEDTFRCTQSPFSAPEITGPLTVAFGTRDWILPESSRRRLALPPHTRWVTRRGWGHVPMWADAAGVADLILGVLM